MDRRYLYEAMHGLLGSHLHQDLDHDSAAESMADCASNGQARVKQLLDEMTVFQSKHSNNLQQALRKKLPVFCLLPMVRAASHCTI